MYWWLQARIQPCVMYSKELGIKCVNESLVEDLFKQGVTTDIVTLDQLSRDSFTWGNIYVTVDKTRWMGYEIFLRPIVHIEEDKNLPSVCEMPLFPSSLRFAATFARCCRLRACACADAGGRALSSTLQERDFLVRVVF